MKVTKTQKPIAIAVAVCALLLVFFIGMGCTSDWRARRSLKHECGAGIDCACLSNVIDNRLNRAQVRAFRAFLDSVKMRPGTNILEFTDEASARGISEAVALCRPAPVQPQQQKTNQTKGKK